MPYKITIETPPPDEYNSGEWCEGCSGTAGRYRRVTETGPDEHRVAFIAWLCDGCAGDTAKIRIAFELKSGDWLERSYRGAREDAWQKSCRVGRSFT